MTDSLSGVVRTALQFVRHDAGVDVSPLITRHINLEGPN